MTPISNFWITALFGAATGYGVMILAMTATPIVDGAPPTLVVGRRYRDPAACARHVRAVVLHGFTGRAIRRVLRIMLTGVVLLATHVLMTLTGTGFQSFAAALITLGIGWNFLYT